MSVFLAPVKMVVSVRIQSTALRVFVFLGSVGSSVSMVSIFIITIRKKMLPKHIIIEWKK